MLNFLKYKIHIVSTKIKSSLFYNALIRLILPECQKNFFKNYEIYRNWYDNKDGALKQTIFILNFVTSIFLILQFYGDTAEHTIPETWFEIQNFKFNRAVSEIIVLINNEGFDVKDCDLQNSEIDLCFNYYLQTLLNMLGNKTISCITEDVTSEKITHLELLEELLSSLFQLRIDFEFLVNTNLSAGSRTALLKKLMKDHLIFLNKFQNFCLS